MNQGNGSFVLPLSANSTQQAKKWVGEIAKPAEPSRNSSLQHADQQSFCTISKQFLNEDLETDQFVACPSAQAG
jgi:hypothetical protein